MTEKNRGFSLIELIIIITIMVVLVAFLSPNFLRFLPQARKEACTSNKGEYYRVFNLFLFFEEPESEPKLTDFYAFAAKNNLIDRTEICPAHGVCLFEIEKRTLSITCSVHDDALPTQLYVYKFSYGTPIEEMRPHALVNAKVLYTQAQKILAEQLAANPAYNAGKPSIPGDNVIINLQRGATGEPYRGLLKDLLDADGNQTFDDKGNVKKEVFGETQIVFKQASDGTYTEISHVYFQLGSFWVKYSPSATEFGTGTTVSKNPPDPSLSK